MSRNFLAPVAGTLVAIASLGAVVAVAAPGASAKTAGSAAAAKAVLKVASVNVGGSKHDVLETATGHPVYLLTGDSTSHPTCTSAECLGAWPVVTATSGKPALGQGVKGKLTIWNHGKYHQVVLNGHPLYTFAGDSGAGSATGQGVKSFGGVWETLTASGSAFSASSTSSSSGSGSGSSSSGSSSSSSGW